jgi:hypothetical protein
MGCSLRNQGFLWYVKVISVECGIMADPVRIADILTTYKNQKNRVEIES